MKKKAIVKKKMLNLIISIKRNAVIVWQTHPSLRVIKFHRRTLIREKQSRNKNSQEPTETNDFPKVSLLEVNY